MRNPPVDVYGDSGPRAVVMLHGAVVNRRMWVDVATRVAPTWPVLAPDLPGHGELGSIPFSMVSAVDSVVRLLDIHDVEHAVLVGESLGGYVALAAAREQPRRVGGMFLSGASLNPTGAVGAVFGGYGVLAGAVARTLDADRLESWTRRALLRSFPEAPVASMRELGFSVTGRPDSLRDLAGCDLLAAIEGGACPVLLLNGRRDLPNRLGARSIARRHPLVEVRTIDGAGHGAALARPAAFADELLRFLARLADS